MIARGLNKDCACSTLDKALLEKEFSRHPDLKSFYQDLKATRPHLFSNTSVFLSQKDFDQLTHFSQVLEKTIQNSTFQSMVLSYAPEIAQKASLQKGVFMGLDFHLNEDGPKLIEINTNAGGAYLNLLLARAHVSCCQEMNEVVQPSGKFSQMEEEFYEMFMQEWKLQHPEQKLKKLAIVDDAPANQYLFPEFLLFQKLLSQQGVKVLIVDGSEFKFENGKLTHENETIDLIYNRLTDFYLEDEKHRAIKDAYLGQAVVLTPNPHHHALYAHKANLTLLSDAEKLSLFGLSPEEQQLLLSALPQTIMVTENNADTLWSQRASWFFKPVRGYGSKATYRGDKLTTRVWGEIKQSSYVAQRLIPPAKRIVRIGESTNDLKNDIRLYTYGGKVQLMCARLYEGQTTNFRTEGGGFAPVLIV
jgi:hypothetical protein